MFEQGSCDGAVPPARVSPRVRVQEFQECQHVVARVVQWLHADTYVTCGPQTQGHRAGARNRALRHAGTRATRAHDRHSHRHRQTVPVMAQRREDRRATTALDDKAVCDLIKCASSKTTRRHCTSKRTHGAQRRRREANSAATTPYEVRMIRAELKIDCLSSPARWLP